MASSLRDSLLLSCAILPLLVQGQTYPDPGGCKQAAPTTTTHPDGTQIQCGYRGSWSNSDTTEFILGVSDITSCRNVCLRRSDPSDNKDGVCESFGYDSANKLCGIYSDYVATGLSFDSESPQIFYDAKCYTCPTRCPAKAGVTLLDNGGFEKYPGNIAPWKVESDVTQDSIITPGNNSARAAKFNAIKSTNPDDQVWVVVQGYNVCQNTLYSISADYKLTGPAKDVQGGNAALLAQVGDFYIDPRYEPNRDLTYKANTWLHFNDFFYIGPKTPLAPDDTYRFTDTVAFGAIYPLVGTLDNVFITPYTGSLTPKSTAPNLIKNPGFERTALTPWIPTVYPDEFTGDKLSSIGRVCTTSCFLRANVTVSDTQVDAPVAAINQTISGLALGKPYLLSFKYYTPVATNLVLNFGPASYGQYNHITIKGSGTYKRPVIARKASTMFQMQVAHARSSDASYTVDFDDFALKAL